MDNSSKPDKKDYVYARIKLIISVFITTFKIGCITFGGGLAMISVIHSEFCDKKKWVSASEISDITAVAQTLPGIIAVNASVLSAYRIGGWPTAIAAGLGSILPSMITLCIVTVFYNSFMSNSYVRGFLRGVSGAVIALFISTLYKLYKNNLADIYAVIIFIASSALIFVFPSINVIFIIIGGAIIGFIIYYLILRKWRKSDIV